MTVDELRQAARDGRATITPDEAFELAGTSRASFYRALAAGEIPGALRLGRRRLVALYPFAAWLQIPLESQTSDRAQTHRADAAG